MWKSRNSKLVETEQIDGYQGPEWGEAGRAGERMQTISYRMRKV